MRFILFLIVLIAFPLHAQKSIHTIWTAELQRYVDEKGDVDYASWQKNTEILNNYIKTLEENPPAHYWSKNDSLSYFINAYNAVTVKLILDNYPLKSIKNLITPWYFKRFNLNEKKVSLNYIEHKILRKMNEPRIHFAINCASKSCPKLLDFAFEPHRINRQLEEATKHFLNDPTKNTITVNQLKLSKIFQWFSKDFGNNQTRLAFIQKYTSIQIDPKASIKFLEYDWGLNNSDTNLQEKKEK